MISDLEQELSEDFDTMEQWCKETYDRDFAKYFKIQDNLCKNVEKGMTPLSDAELEAILLEIPLQLVEVSEKLNSLRVKQSMSKMHLKKAKAEKSDNATELELLVSMYDSVIDMVEKKISFSKEFIMGVKKIWDGRRRAEQSNPVAPIDGENLPDYNSINKPKDGKMYG